MSLIANAFGYLKYKLISLQSYILMIYFWDIKIVYKLIIYHKMIFSC